MLRVNLRPSCLILRNAPNELVNSVIVMFDLESEKTGDGIRIFGKPKTLYDVLVYLALDHDLEIV